MSAEHGENQPKESLSKIYYRLNVENGEVVGLDEWQKMGRLKKLADDYMAHEDQAATKRAVVDLLSRSARDSPVVGTRQLRNQDIIEVLVYPPGTDNFQLARLFLDTGTRENLISKHLVRRLGLTLDTYDELTQRIFSIADGADRVSEGAVILTLQLTNSRSQHTSKFWVSEDFALTSFLEGNLFLIFKVILGLPCCISRGKNVGTEELKTRRHHFSKSEYLGCCSPLQN